uniref:RRM domain-containing protein n=1 Tax=Knipowitschia caucasica TaxID=637954 RepID=A0AAV2M7M3_KNICA
MHILLCTDSPRPRPLRNSPRSHLLSFPFYAIFHGHSRRSSLAPTETSNFAINQQIKLPPCIVTVPSIASVWVARNPPGFAFVEFEDPRDATDAVRELDGRTMCDCRVRVELSSGEKRSRSRGAPPPWSRRPRERDDYRGRRSSPARRRATTMPLLTTL